MKPADVRHRFHAPKIRWMRGWGQAPSKWSAGFKRSQPIGSQAMGWSGDPPAGCAQFAYISCLFSFLVPRYLAIIALKPKSLQSADPLDTHNSLQPAASNSSAHSLQQGCNTTQACTLVPTWTVCSLPQNPWLDGAYVGDCNACQRDLSEPQANP